MVERIASDQNEIDLLGLGEVCEDAAGSLHPALPDLLGSRPGLNRLHPDLPIRGM